MKSFLYEIPERFFSNYKVITPFRIKVYYERRVIDSVLVTPDLLILITPTAWTHIWVELNNKAKELYEQSLASVDITPGDGCPHSDNMIPE
jgi:hypothetical protein